MSSQRRVRVPGASYFFTVNLARKGGTALADHIDDLRLAFVRTAAEHPIFCDAMVVLPDHLHAVWTLPEGDADCSARWRQIKARFTRAVRGRVGFNPTIPAAGVVGWNPTLRTQSEIAKGDAGIWQRRFWEHAIRDDEDYANHIRYCWGNPVRHGLVARAVDWPFSSIHRDIRAGRADAVWAGATAGGEFGE